MTSSNPISNGVSFRASTLRAVCTSVRSSAKIPDITSDSIRNSLVTVGLFHHRSETALQSVEVVYSVSTGE
jgi:hypothetical protein